MKPIIIIELPVTSDQHQIDEVRKYLYDEFKSDKENYHIMIVAGAIVKVFGAPLLRYPYWAIKLKKLFGL